MILKAKMSEKSALLFVNLKGIKRVKALCECIELGRNPDLSYFGEMLSAAEMGYLASLANSEKGDKNPLMVLKDSIKVILDEGIRIKSGDTKSMSVDDWAQNLQKIIEAKQKGK